MKSPHSSELIGRRVAEFEVLGKEHDGVKRWVGADMELIIPPLGRFFMNIVTKAQYASEQLAETFADVDSPEQIFAADDDVERRDPFVLNDEEITDEVLHRKFDNRVVEQDLADCLWYQGPLV